MREFSSTINLTIIVPCFNESLELENTVKTNIADARKYLNNFEIIIVNDGSTDDSPKIAELLDKKYSSVRVVTHKKNLGLGTAILSGAKIASYDLITYLPGDGQAYLRDIIAGVKKAKDADLVLTYRTSRSDYTVYRKFLSWCLTILLRILFNLRFRDYNWVHIYKKNIFSRIKIKSHGVFFLGEIVIKAERLGLKIVQVESMYRPRRFGTSKTVKLRSVCRAFFDLLGIWYDLLWFKNEDQSKKKS